MPDEKDIFTDVVQTGFTNDRKLVHFVFKTAAGDERRLFLRAGILDRVIYALHTVAAKLSQLVPEKPPLPGETLRLSYLDATDVGVAGLGDERLILRIETKQGLSPNVALTRQQCRQLQAAVSRHLETRKPAAKEQARLN